MTPEEAKKETPQSLYDEICLQGLYDDGGFTRDAIRALDELRNRATRLAAIESIEDEEVDSLIEDFASGNWGGTHNEREKAEESVDELGAIIKALRLNLAEVGEMATWMIEAMTLEQLDQLIERAKASNGVIAMAQFCSESIARKDYNRLGEENGSLRECLKHIFECQGIDRSEMSSAMRTLCDRVLLTGEWADSGENVEVNAAPAVATPEESEENGWPDPITEERLSAIKTTVSTYREFWAKKTIEDLVTQVEWFRKAAKMVRADIGSKKLNDFVRIHICVSSLSLLMEALGADVPTETS